MTTDRPGQKQLKANALHTAIYQVSLAYNLIMNKMTARGWWTRITDSIILGALPLLDRNHHRILKEEGVVAIVTMNQPYELEKSMLGTPVTPDDWKALDIDQCMGTTQDFTPPSMDTITRCVDFMIQRIEQGGVVYVHCKAGRGRSTIVVAAYLMRTRQWSPQVALNFIQSKRSHINMQQTILLEYESYLRAEQSSKI